jgi:putative oxidoreductase
MWTLDFLAKQRWLPPLVLRAVMGFAFFAVHGMDKLRPGGTWDFGQAFVKSAAGTAPAPLLYLAAYTEFLAGLGILVGFLTRWAAFGIFCVMAYAVLVVHAGDEFPKFELALAFGACSVALMVMGPGSLSVDRLVFGTRVLGE